MADCKKIVRTSKRICAGALNRKIIVFTRDIKVPEGGSVDFGEEFILNKTVWSMVDTVKGTIIFDEVNIARDITHNIFIRYFKDLEMTQEKWIGLPSIDGGKNIFLDIIRVENIQEENRFHLLQCALRGDDTKSSTFA